VALADHTAVRLHRRAQTLFVLKPDRIGHWLGALSAFVRRSDCVRRQHSHCPICAPLRR
jgi:hypothetical protein